MSGDDQQKGASVFNFGPETYPGLKLAEHGQGGPPRLVYTSNPVSFSLDSLGRCFPFLSIASGNRDKPVERRALDEIEGWAYSAGNMAELGSSGGFFEHAAPYAYMRNADVGELANLPGGVVPIINVGGKPVAAWGSRRNL